MFLTPYQLALIAGGFAIIGALLGNWISFLLANIRSKNERLTAARLAFRDAFTPALRLIEKGGVTYEEVGQFTSFFDSQHDAMITFRNNLRGYRRTLFDEKWSEYKGWQIIYKDYDEGTRMIAIGHERGRDFHQIVNDLFLIIERHFMLLYLSPPKKRSEYNQENSPG